MNVTDVDDKIILRARRNYLIDQYKVGIKSPQEVSLSAALDPEDKKIH